jgi:transposase InsO family protein
VPQQVRDEVVDFVTRWSREADIPVAHFVEWLEIRSSKYYDWRRRYGQANEHNGRVPRRFWLQAWEREAIIDFYRAHPDEGYRRLTYMMIDADIVAASPSSVYRVLKQAELLNRWNQKPSKKGQGFRQPEKPHEHWHIDVAYINICGTFYYLCSILDGYSRYLVHWEIRETMTEADVEIIVQRARERFPLVQPRIISDNGPQFVARDFKTFIRQCGMTHVRTSPYYPQSNGKIERWHKSLKKECIRPGTPLSLEDARQLVNRFVMYYNQVRLHSAIGYVTPRDKLRGRESIIFAERKRKLAAARKRRAWRSQAEPRASQQGGLARLRVPEPCPL